MRKILLMSMITTLSLVVFGCAKEENQGKNLDREEIEESKEQSNKGKVNNTYKDIVVKKVAIETENRMVEGMEEEIVINKYEILPLGIAYHIDERFGNPEVRDGIVKYSINEEEYLITLKIFDNKSLDEAIGQLQKDLEDKQYEAVDEIEDIPLEENSLTGKMQHFLEPIAGFYAYDIGNHVLAITYEYPIEAGDGMGPLLHSLRQSINIE